MNNHVLLIGVGNMGSAMLDGWIASGLFSGNISAIDPKAALLQSKYGASVRFINQSKDIASEFDAVVLAIKPQIFPDIYRAYKNNIGNAVVLSIAAGIETLSIADGFGLSCSQIARAMPNLPAAFGMGACGLYMPPQLSLPRQALIRQLLTPLGMIVDIADESHMHVVTALSGSGPAYVFAMAECMAAAGVDLGLPKDVAEKLARQTMIGAAQILAQNSSSPQEWRNKVTSPNGTTDAALKILLAQPGLADLLRRAMAAAAQRSQELSQHQ